MSQNRIRLGLAANGSITAVDASGIRIMSLSLIAFHPAIDEPSNMIPSRNASSLMVETCCAVCCHLPRGSVNRRSTYSTACSVIVSRTLPTPSPFSVAILTSSPLLLPGGVAQPGLDCVPAALAGADPHGVLHRHDEDL